MRLLWSLALVLATDIHLQAVLPQEPRAESPGDPFSASDVYRENDPSVKPVRLIKDPKPNYTSLAMQNRIEGVVKMIALVERDGNIGAVRITQSLDPEYGLDAMAVETLKQWRFSPATKDGVPVRVRIDVEMSFTLRGGKTTTEPTVRWPEAFTKYKSVLEDSNGSWAEQELSAAPLQLTIRYPKGWALAAPPDGKIFAATLESERYPRGFAVSQPVKVQTDQTATMTDRLLNKMADQVKTQVAKDGGFKLLKFGQIRAPLRLWFWAEMTRHLTTASGEGTMHLWVFSTTEQHQQLSVFCSVVVPGDSRTMEMREQLNRAGADFAAMVTRVVIAAQ